MPLSKKGIDKLEKIMLANGEWFYNQSQFGLQNECGTELCGAGFARLLEVGQAVFHKETKRHTEKFSEAFANRCLQSGKKLLGVKSRTNLVQIFDYPSNWPSDLADRFEKLISNSSKIKFYINMLRTRANSDGSIREAK